MVSSQQRHIEIFLICDVGNRVRRLDFNVFFTKAMLEINANIAIKPLFFNEETALGYMNFMGSNHCILHAYIPESAIEGHFEELCLKKNSVMYKHIHGCFANNTTEKTYIVNEAFDTSILSLVSAPEDHL